MKGEHTEPGHPAGPGGSGVAAGLAAARGLEAATEAGPQGFGRTFAGV
ncbi:hypothetical protein ACQ86N_38670 [Puia sp. P3]